MTERFLRRLTWLFAAKTAYISLISVMAASLALTHPCRAEKAAQKKTEERKPLADLSEKEKNELIEEAKSELNNKVWDITLKLSDPKKVEEEEDILRFEDSRFISDKLQSEGFDASNYTVRLKGKTGEIIVWETMQTSEESGVAFWRGELRGDVARGVLSWHIDDKNKKDYTFTSKGKKDIVLEPEEEVPTAPEPAVVEEKINEPE